jgi:hypothetical protein
MSSTVGVRTGRTVSARKLSDVVMVSTILVLCGRGSGVRCLLGQVQALEQRSGRWPVGSEGPPTGAVSDVQDRFWTLG